MLVLLAALWLAIVAGAWAEAAETVQDTATVERGPASSGDSAGTNTNDEYNFNWLDTDKKIYVLQNRKYLKANHVLLSLMTGPGWSNPYRSVWNIDPRIAYYVSESFGLEVFYKYTMNSVNSTAQALNDAAPNKFPVVREIQSQLGLLVHWVPWYAKINVFNQILYFDWYFSAGAGTLQSQIGSQTLVNGPTTYTPDSRGVFYLGTGHQFYINNSLVVRLDVTGGYYRAPIGGTTGDSGWFSNYDFGFGLGLRL